MGLFKKEEGKCIICGKMTANQHLIQVPGYPWGTQEFFCSKHIEKLAKWILEGYDKKRAELIREVKKL